MDTPKNTKKGHWVTVGPNPRIGADILYKIVSANPKENSLLPAYISSVCASIEARINEGYIRFYYQKFGSEYKKHVNTFLHLSFEMKLKHLIHLVTDFRYELNPDNPYVRFLFKVITLRNKLVHVQHHMKPGTFIFGSGDGFDFEYDENDKSCYYAIGEWKDLTSEDISEIHTFLDVILPLLFKLSQYENPRALVTSGFLKKVVIIKDRPGSDLTE